MKKNPQLCLLCRTGRDTYMSDSKELFCPYIHCCDGTNCSMFVPLKNKKQTFFHREKYDNLKD